MGFLANSARVIAGTTTKKEGADWLAAVQEAKRKTPGWISDTERGLIASGYKAMLETRGRKGADEWRRKMLDWLD